MSDDAIGYKRPPKHSRFKKGQSGNPKGRPRKSTDFQKLLRDELERTVLVKIGDKTKKLSNLEVIIKSIMSGARRVDPKCIKIVFDCMRDAPAPEPFGINPEEEDDLRRALQVIKNISQPSEE